MALISALLSAVDHHRGRAAQTAARPRREPDRTAEADGERARVPLKPRLASYVQCQVAGVGRVEVAYERQGMGEPVVLLHGLGCHRQTWEPVIPLLSAHREVIAVDLPGSGQSPDLAPGVPRDLETAMLWLSPIFTALGVERPHVVGHSMGGLLALRLGQAGLARSVTALAPAGFWTRAERRYTYAVLHATHCSVRLLPQSTLEALVSTPLARAVLTGTLYGRAEACSPQVVAAVLRTLKRTPAVKAALRAGRAPSLFTGDIPDVPVTVAWGTRDRILPPRQAARVRALVPQARMVPLHGCGHVPMLDAAELVARTIFRATELRVSGLTCVNGSFPQVGTDNRVSRDPGKAGAPSEDRGCRSSRHESGHADWFG